MSYPDISHSPTLDALSAECINTRLEEAVVSEEAELKLRGFALNLEAHLRAYCMVLKQNGAKKKDKVDFHINELLFKLDGDVRKVRSHRGACAKVWATAMEKIITELAEIPYTFPKDSIPGTAPHVASDEAHCGGSAEEEEREDDIDTDGVRSPVSVCREELPNLSQEEHDAAVYQTWRRYLASTELEAFSPIVHDDEGDAKPDPDDFVATALYARWEGSFGLVDCLARTENTGHHILALMAYVDLLMATVRQMQCYATGTRCEEAAQLAALARADGDAHRERLLQELTENLLFRHQVWWWWRTKVNLVRERIAAYDAAHGDAERAKGEAAAAAHDANIATWRGAVDEAERAASAVVAATHRDMATVAVSVLRHDIASALTHPSGDTRDTVQVSCRVVARAIAFFLRSLPDEFYSSPCNDGAASSSTSEAATKEYLGMILSQALKPTAEDVLEHAEEWFAHTNAGEDEEEAKKTDGDATAASAKRQALQGILGIVEHYWGKELTATNDIVQTLKRI